MRVLLWKDLWDARVVWLGVLVVTATATLALSIPGVLIRTGLAVQGVRGLALFSLAGTTATLTVIASVIVLTGVLRLTVTARSTAISLWAAIGVTPRRIAVIIAAEVALVSALGALGGALVSPVVAPAAVSYGLTGADGLQDTLPVADPWTFAASALVVLAVACPCAFVAGRRAARLSPLTAIRQDPECVGKPRRWTRLVFSLGLLVIAVAMVSSLKASGSSDSQLLLIGPVLAGSAAAAGGVLFAPLEWLWTRPLRSVRWSPVALARAAATASAARNDATVSAGVIAVGLPTGLLAGAETLTSLSGGSGAGAAPAIALLVGGASVLAAVAAAVSTAMTSRTRTREQARLRAAGAGDGVVLGVTTMETAIHILTAAIVTAAALGLGMLGEWVAFRGPIGIGLAAFAVAVGVVLVAVAVSAAVPAWRGLRRSVPELLASRE